MKRTVLWLLFLCFLTMSSSAFEFDMDDRLLIGTGNDRYTMGISKNYDDNLSFNSLVDYQNGKLHLMTYLNGYTDRAGGKRHDELLFLGSWNFGLFRDSAFRVDIMPSLGLDLDGYLGFSDLQNGLHEIIGMDVVDLSYPGENTLKPYADLLLSARYFTRRPKSQPA